MKRTLCVLFALMMAISHGVANDSANVAMPVVQTPEEVYAEANKDYADGNYREAVCKYERILKDYGQSAEIYYNLGNAYYRAGEIAASILNYERALRLEPSYSDAKANLAIANARTIDRIDEQKSLLGGWLSNVTALFHSTTWTYISVITFVLFLGLVFLFVFGKTPSMRKLGFYTGVCCLLLSVISLFLAYKRHAVETDHSEAILMPTEVNVKSSPDEHGTDIFLIHSGCKVRIGESIGDWCEVSLSDGTKGWVKASVLERI
ncbi:MAG: tetratricopeptide repeat protein [Paludibacteraceae bacterium]|nr:tetratricopeptide repeat protein [Paludibacteraceae bacterium]